MAHMTTRFLISRSISILVIAAFLVVAGCSRQDQARAPTQPAPSDDHLPQSPIGTLVRNHLAAATGVGIDAQSVYEASLAALRSQSADVARVIAESYPKVEVARYFRRWLLIQTLGELHDNTGYELLRQVAQSPIPEEAWRDPEASSRSKEINIRATAVDGLAALARQGNQEADQALLELAKHNELTIRRRAIRGYLAAGDQSERAATLRKVLPVRDDSLVTLSVTDLKTVPHPNIALNQLPTEQNQSSSAPRVHR